MKVAVAGGTGMVGRLVVSALRERGDTPVVLARSAGVDVATGSGLDAALAGSDAVIDVTNVVTSRGRPAIAFFERATTNLLAAEQRAGVAQHVALSIVGIDRVPLGYYAGKRRQEELVLAGPVPGTILRATQFHEFAAQMIERAGALGCVFAPRMLSQTVAVSEVALALVECVHGSPAGLAPDLAGPERHELPDLIKQLLHARGKRRLVVPVRIPGAAGKAMASGGLLPSSDGPRGTRTFAEWLAAGER